MDINEKDGRLTMTDLRKLLVILMALVILGGHLLCVIFRKEAWPFSNYPMYSWIMPERWEVLELDGVPANHDKPEFVLSNKCLPRSARRMQGIQRLVKNLKIKENGNDELRLALLAMVNLYEVNRLENANWAEPIRAMNIYTRVFERRKIPKGFEIREVDRVKLASSYD